MYYNYKYTIFGILLFSSLAHAIVFTHKSNPFATHQPVLYEIATRTTGAIIEFGCGDSSTQLLHEICSKTKRLLISLDDDWEWLNKFTKKYLNDGYSPDNSGWHKFFYVPGKTSANNDDPERWVTFLNNCELLNTLTFDLCFIDQNPWLARFETMKKMKGKARYVIVHDFNYFPMHKIFGKMIKLAFKGDPGEFDLSDVYTYFKVYFPCLPWPGDYGPGTLLASDTESDLPDIDFSKY